MKKNLYTDGISKIKVSEKVLNAGIEAAKNYDSEQTSVNINTAKPKKKYFKPIAAAAAVLAVAVATGTVLSIIGHKSNPFILTAGATELNSETYIEVGNLDFISQTSNWGGRECKLQGGKLISDKNEAYTLYWFEGEFNLGIQCKGENIESITYTVNNGHFLVDDSYEGCISYNFSDSPEGYGTINNMKLADTCTFAYNMQPQSRLDFEVPEGGVDGSYPLIVAFRAEDTDNLYHNNPEKYTVEHEYKDANPLDYVNYALLASDLINSSPNEYSVDFTANFADGSASTKTIVFRCKTVEDKNFESETKCRLEAKIAEK
ncbi:MAG: hypothetical protein ACI4HN_05160 [Ruminococcus sp.]